MGFYLPKTLQSFDNWVLWRLENGKKKPYSVKYNGLASVAKPYQWSSYESARLKFKYTEPEYNGMGFVFTEDCGLVFIDLDHCINEDSGELTSFANNIVNAFSGTYIEYSQSGAGLHIVCKGTIPAAYKGKNIELYSSLRYMAFTGNAFEAAEPTDKQKELNRLIAFYDIKKREPEQIDAQPITAADDEIIRKASSGGNGENFRALYAGEWQGKYKTQSNADMRLVALIWYYSRNYEQTRRIFLASGLGQREKASREDYIQGLIETAAKNTPTAAGQGICNRAGNYIAKAPKEEQQHNGRRYWDKIERGGA